MGGFRSTEDEDWRHSKTQAGKGRDFILWTANYLRWLELVILPTCKSSSWPYHCVRKVLGVWVCNSSRVKITKVLRILITRIIILYYDLIFVGSEKKFLYKYILGNILKSKRALCLLEVVVLGELLVSPGVFRIS